MQNRGGRIDKHNKKWGGKDRGYRGPETAKQRAARAEHETRYADNLTGPAANDLS